MSKSVYSTEAVVEGGRDGHARTSDGRLDVDLVTPAELGGPGGEGTNPEQLFAAGYAACFLSTLEFLGGKRKLDLSDSRLTGRVALVPRKEGMGFQLEVELDLDAPNLAPDEAGALMGEAHGLCPYSHATRGNIDVTLSASGAAVEAEVA